MKSKPLSNDELARQRHHSFSRRNFLRGLGACIALPAFESILPVRLFAAAANPAGKLATTASGAPLRTAFVYFPNGAIPSAWWPTSQESNFEFSRTLQPLANARQHLQILGGLDHLNATAGRRRRRRSCAGEWHISHGRALEEERHGYSSRHLH